LHAGAAKNANELVSWTLCFISIFRHGTKYLILMRSRR